MACFGLIDPKCEEKGKVVVRILLFYRICEQLCSSNSVKRNKVVLAKIISSNETKVFHIYEYYLIS